MTPDHWITQLNLLPHPEGGWYRETYRAAESIPAAALPARFRGPRAFGTSIYFLLPATSFSAFHRIHSDELWHFHAGDPLELHLLHPDGRHEVLPVGPGAFQAVGPRGLLVRRAGGGGRGLHARRVHGRTGL
jgi:predicted cupin superfamily sugar epimerase